MMASQMFLPIFLLFFLQPHSTYAHHSNTSTQNTSSPFEFLSHFSGVLKKGDTAKFVHELKEHLMYLGYLDRNNYHNNNNFDEHLEHAIKKYQEFFHLNITGVLDSSTITSICAPRCGVPDLFTPQTLSKSLYAFIKGNPKWDKTRLKYHMTKKVIKAYRPPIERALLAWQSATPFRFTHVNNYSFNRADIMISFERGNHGDGVPFIPNDPRMAHSFQPPNGTVHFDAAQRWASNGDRSAYDIQTVALHEFGHILGLDHSNVPQAIMFPKIGMGERKGLHQDDIRGIKALYHF